MIKVEWEDKERRDRDNGNCRDVGGGSVCDCGCVCVCVSKSLYAKPFLLMKRESLFQLSCLLWVQLLVFLPRVCPTTQFLQLFFFFFFSPRMSPIVKSPECTPVLCHCKLACTNNTLSLMFGCTVRCRPFFVSDDHQDFSGFSLWVVSDQWLTLCFLYYWVIFKC